MDQSTLVEERPTEVAAPGTPHVNGTDRTNADPSANGADASTCTGAHVARAEHLIDRFGTRLGSLVVRCGQGVRWLGARTRGQLEDLWSEAQRIRRGDPQS
jgi:hypothetical protein